MIAAHALDLTFLQYTQKSNLGVGGEVADFIKK